MGKANLDPARHQIEKSEARWQPRQVLLFSGHMIDAPDRRTPRFPAVKESIAAQKISEALDTIGRGSRRPCTHARRLWR